MQFCDFSGCVIRDNTPQTYVIANTNFNQSSFFNANLKTVFVENTSVSQSQFLGTTIYNTHFSHATLQDISSEFVNLVPDAPAFIKLLPLNVQETYLPFLIRRLVKSVVTGTPTA